MMQAAEPCCTSTREGKAFRAEGCIPGSLSSSGNKGKCKDKQDWNRTIEMVCMNTVADMRVMVSVRLMCKEKG